MVLTCDAVIFDLDGVVINSDPVAERHWKLWTARHGVPFAHVLEVHHGRPTAETIRLVAPHLDASAEARVKENAEAEDFEGLSLYEGASALLHSLPRERWGVATSGTRRTVALRRGQLGFPEPPVLVTADDVARGKPAPDPYILAAERLGVPAARCVVIEDAPAGIVAARAAGARVIAIASTHPREALAAADGIAAALADVTISVLDRSLSISFQQA
jgi:sugar-phosphatase